MITDSPARSAESHVPPAPPLPARILAVAPQPFFSPRGTPLSVYYRALVTSELGVPVDILTYGQGDDVDLPGVRIFRIPTFGITGKIKIGPSWLKLFLDVFIFLRTIELLIRNRYPVVHAHEESVFFLAAMKRLFGFKLIYDMHSSLPEQLGNYRFTSSRAIVGTFERLEGMSLRNADAVITICPELARYAQPRMPDPSRHFLIENSIFDDVRLKTASGMPAPPMSIPALPAGRKLIVYAGTFEAYQGLENLIEALPRVVAASPQALLVLAGGQPKQIEKLAALARDRGVAEYCLFVGSVPQPVANAVVERADVLVSPRSVGTNTPLKIYQLLASGIPLVATRVLSHTQILDESVCFLVDPEPGSLAEGIIAALEDHEARRRVSSNALAFYEREYARDAYTRKMRQLLASVG